MRQKMLYHVGMNSKKTERRTDTMKFQELLAGKQINWDRVKLIRHNLTKEEIAANYERGYLELYQSVQNHARFRDCDMVISFWGRKARMVFFGAAIALVVQSHISAQNSQKILYQIAA